MAAPSASTYPLSGPAGGTVIGVVEMYVDGAGKAQPKQGASFYNTNANTAGYQVKTGAGVFLGLSTNTVGLTSSVTLYDGTSTAGAKIGTYATLVQGGPMVPSMGITFATGLFMVAAGGTPADVTVSYL